MKMAAPGHLRLREGEQIMKFVVAIQRKYSDTGGNTKTANDSKANFFDGELVLPEIFIAEWQEQHDPR